MFGIGMSEMIIICVVALLVFGPDELPQIVKKVARGIGEARKVTDDLRRSIDLVDDEEEDRRARTFARSQQALQQSSSTGGALAEPEVIPGSALTPVHGDDAPMVVAPAGAVAVGAPDEEPEDRAGATGAAADASRASTTPTDGPSHGAEAAGGGPAPVTGR